MTDAADGANTESDREPSVREEWDWMLSTLDTAVAEAERKVKDGRVYNPDHEKVRIKWVNALSRTVDTRRKVLAAKQEAEIEERISRLEEIAEQAQTPSVSKEWR